MTLVLNQQTTPPNEPYHPLPTHLAESAIRTAASSIVRRMSQVSYAEVCGILTTDLWLLCKSQWVQLVDLTHRGRVSFVARRLCQVFFANTIHWKRLNPCDHGHTPDILESLADPSADASTLFVTDLLKLIEDTLGTRARAIAELRIAGYQRREIAVVLNIPLTTYDYEYKRISDVLSPYSEMH